jgi:hypothetical protein
MTEIVLSPEQSRAARSSDEPIKIVTDAGDVLGIVQPFVPLTADEERELLRRMAAPDSDFITTEELLARLERRFA